MSHLNGKIYHKNLKNNLKILFRVSGGKAKNKELGMGHVYRCLNIASEIKKSNVYFLVEDYGGLKKIFENKKISNVNYIKKNITKESDFNKTIKNITKNNIDIVIVDKYCIDFEYISKLKNRITTIVISDLKNIDYYADLLINGFVGFENQIHYNKQGTRCLLGPKFQILDSKFQKYKKEKKNNDLLVTFGGIDENNIIEKILKILDSRENKIKTKIILGPAKEKSPMIKKFIKKKYSWLKILQETSNMKKEISNSKFGLCSGGLTTYEMAALNVPFGIICQVKHQLITAREWQKLDYGINLGLGTEFNTKKFEEFFENINLKKSNEKKIIDGYGVSRVIMEILKTYEKKDKN